MAIERPGGILLHRLLETGLTVVPVHPNQAKAARDRYSVARGLRDSWMKFADSTRHPHPCAGEVYARATARGQNHPHAIWTLARAWVPALWRCWNWPDGVVHEPIRHGALVLVTV